MLVIVFFGDARSDSAREGRESPAVMTMPLIVLAILATLGGFAFFARNFLTLPPRGGGGPWFLRWQSSRLFSALDSRLFFTADAQPSRSQSNCCGANSISTNSMAGSLIGHRSCWLAWQLSLTAGSSMQARWAAAAEGPGASVRYAINPSRQSSSVRVSVWLGRCRADLGGCGGFVWRFFFILRANGLIYHFLSHRCGRPDHDWRTGAEDCVGCFGSHLCSGAISVCFSGSRARRLPTRYVIQHISRVAAWASPLGSTA